MTREEILKDAIRCVCTDRNEQYGEPEDNFSVIAELWSVYLAGVGVAKVSGSISAFDVAVMMALFKIGRSMTAEDQKADTFIDACGYLACAGQIGCGGEENDMV